MQVSAIALQDAIRIDTKEDLRYSMFRSDLNFSGKLAANQH